MMMKVGEKCLDSQLWHTCAEGMVQMSTVNSKMYYFSQGQAKHDVGHVDFGVASQVPPLILCRVAIVKNMADPPIQTVLAKDVHGETWKFRNIYRGTPRRHSLTTGWSSFVNQKKLVAGDSIVFLRTENEDLCVGIRRAKRVIGGGFESSSGWNPPSANYVAAYEGFSVFFRKEENKMMRNGDVGRPDLLGMCNATDRVYCAHAKHYKAYRVIGSHARFFLFF